MNIDNIRDRVKGSHYCISEHIMRVLMSHELSLFEIKESLMNGFILETHQHPMRSLSCLVLGYSGEKPVHVVCAEEKDDRINLLLAYIPSPPIWKDATNRQARGERSMSETIRKCFFCNGELKEIQVGNFDYRLEGKLYVFKNIPANLCLQCGEKYISAEVAEKIDAQIESCNFIQTETVQVLDFQS